jgi:hypothetical protein
MTITLHLSADVQRKLEALATEHGQDIEIVANNLFRQAVERGDQNIVEDVAVFPPNEKALAALRQIARMQEGMRHTDGSQTERLIREGRAGGMYSDGHANEMLLTHSACTVIIE